jgi:hypothetical protein
MRVAYYKIRVFTFVLFFAICFSQGAISGLMINDETKYNDMSYGLCSFCYNITECQTDYDLNYPLIDYQTKIATAELQLVIAKASAIIADRTSASDKDI